MSELKDHWQLFDSSGALNLTFDEWPAATGIECQIRSTRSAPSSRPCLNTAPIAFTAPPLPGGPPWVLSILIVGLVVFFASHVFVTARDKRAALIDRLGPGGYRALFSVVSLAGLALIVWGYADYRAHDWIQVWSPPACDAPRHRRPDADLDRRARVFPHPEPHQDLDQASDAGQHQDLGLRPSARPTAISARSCCSGRSWPGRSMPASPPSGAAISGRKTAPAGWTNDIVVVACRRRRLSAARLLLPPLCDRDAGFRRRMIPKRGHRISDKIMRIERS